jgi:hypothetical protein
VKRNSWSVKGSGIVDAVQLSVETHAELAVFILSVAAFTEMSDYVLAHLFWDWSFSAKESNIHVEAKFGDLIKDKFGRYQVA